MEESIILQNQDDTDSVLCRYFSHCNFLSKNIITEQRSLAKFLGNTWKELDHLRKDALLDLLFVEDDIRQHVATSSQTHSRRADERVEESFPRLYVNSGQKINLDFDNDVWTWRDEHSGPFSWMSRSQQDLTLADLEADTITKPQPKTLRVDTDNPDTVKRAEEQFSYPANCWSRDTIDGYRKAEKSISLSPCASLDFSSPKTGEAREEINKAFVDTKEDKLEAVTTASHTQEIQAEVTDRSEDQNNDSVNSGKRKNSGKEKRKRSPSPKKILRSSSLRRSPSKASDQGEQQLITETSDDNYEEKNTFSNPLVETEWSSFVGEHDASANGGQADGNKGVKSCPTNQVMDRGDDLVGYSPYQVQRDNVHLITPAASPAQGGKMSATNVLGGDSSVESTPDHTTHLLKGMEKDKGKTSVPSYQYSVREASVMEKYEKDEVLTVEAEGNDFTITTEPESKNKRDSDIPQTGFDFLDNW